jgi:hypothetical protein
MFLRSNHRGKDGKDHTYWPLGETVRTADGPRQKTLCYLGELNSSAQARWLRTIEVFNEQGEAQQLKLFPAHVDPSPDDPRVARVLLSRVRLERTRQFGPAIWDSNCGSASSRRRTSRRSGPSTVNCSLRGGRQWCGSFRIVTRSHGSLDLMVR